MSDEMWTVTVTVKISVADNASDEEREYAAYDEARNRLNENTADWTAEPEDAE